MGIVHGRVVMNTQLFMRWSTGATAVLVPQTDAKFLDRFFWATVTFVRDERGAVTHLVWRYSGRDYPAKKVKDK